MNLIKEKWSEILEHVRKEHELSDISFETWLLPLTVHSTDNHVVKIIVPMGEQMITYLNSKFKTPIFVAIAEFTGEKYDVEFITEKEAMEQKSAETPASSAGSADRPVNSPDFEKSDINPKFTFDTFVVGSNNKFAHAASLAVAETPGKVYNPLFLHGGVGLGKTHLMHAIANHILKENPNMKVLYVTSEYFTNELIETLRMGDPSGMTRFREKYRNIDVLLIADVSSPDFETRMAILRKKEELEGYHIDDDIITYIATNIKSNIRELEGAFNRLIALSTLEKRPIDMLLAEEAIKDIISPGESRKVTPELIIEIVAEHFHITPADIYSNKRTANIAYPRQVAMYLCKENGTTLKKIGDIMGGRDHTTVMHGVEKIEKELQNNDSTIRTIGTIRKQINPN